MSSRIEAVGTVSGCSIKDKGAELKIAGLKFTGGDYGKVAEWFAAGDKVKVTVEVIQEKLPLEESK